MLFYFIFFCRERFSAFLFVFVVVVVGGALEVLIVRKFERHLIEHAWDPGVGGFASGRGCSVWVG